MTIPNRPSLADIINDPGTGQGLPLDVAHDLMEEAKQQARLFVAAGKIIESDLAIRYGMSIAARYRAEAKDTGTVRVTDGAYEIVADRAKKVEWDQGVLTAAIDRISSAGDDPKEYVDVTFTVPERKYTAWPAHIREVFEPARTVKPGALTLKIVSLAGANRQAEAA